MPISHNPEFCPKASCSFQSNQFPAKIPQGQKFVFIFQIHTTHLPSFHICFWIVFQQTLKQKKTSMFLRIYESILLYVNKFNLRSKYWNFIESIFRVLRQTRISTNSSQFQDFFFFLQLRNGKIQFVVYKYVFSCPPINHAKSLSFGIFPWFLQSFSYLILFQYNERRVALYTALLLSGKHQDQEDQENGPAAD